MFNKHWKKIISMILVLALLLQITPLAVRAEETYPSDLECDPQTGLSPLYEHTPFDAGTAGTAYLNTYLGTMHIRRSDLYLGGERMPVEIEFYHDPTNDVSGNPYGVGWSTSYNQLIYFDTQTGRFAYKNANGTWIYFVSSDEVTEAGHKIWKEDVEYGVGEIGLEVHVQASASVQNYSAVRVADGDTYYYFDNYGRLVRIVNGANMIVVTYISNTNRINYIQDPVGRKFRFGYSGTYLAAIYCQDAEGTMIPNSMVRYSVVSGQLQTVTYSNGDAVSYEYDSVGNLAKMVNVDLCGYTFAYTSGTRKLWLAMAMAAMNTDDEAVGSVTTVAHPTDNQTVITQGTTQQRYTFDGCGRVTNCELLMATSETAAQDEGADAFQTVYGFTLTYGYVEDESGVVSNTVVDVQTYDDEGAIEATCEEESEEETEEETSTEETETDNYSYTTDDYGNILTETYTVGNLSQTTTYTYSEDGNYLTSQTDENGNTVQYEYDLASGLLQLLTDANGNETEYTYNALRELQAVHMDVSGLTNGSGMDASYTYTQGRLTSLTYGAFEYVFSYDIWGNILSVTMNGKNLVTYDYGDDAYKGQVSTMTYGNGQKVYYFYDSLGQISTVGYTNQVKRFAYQYNSDGSLAKIRDLVMGYVTVYTETGFELQLSSGTVVYSYASDEEGNLTETINALTFRYSFDSDSNTTTVTDGNGTSLLSVSSAYDALNRLYNKTITSGYVKLSKGYTYKSSSNGTGSLVSSYSTNYLVGDRQTSFSFRYTYDCNGNITGITQTEQSGTVYTITDPEPGYDVEVMSLAEGETATSATYRTYYSYDEAGQLVEAIDGLTGITYRYSYDNSGNIMSMNAYEYDDSGNEVLVASKTFTYTNGILSGYTDGSTSVRCNSDTAGNLTSTYGGTHTKVLTWGEGRNLMGVRKSTSNYSEYTYNVDGLRTQKIVVENGVSTTTQYIWGNNGLAAIITGDTTVVLIYDNDGEAVGFFVEETEEYTPAIPNAVTQKVYTYVKNLQGDVLRILDENGNTVVSYTYDPWGVPTVTGDADLAALNPCSYRGYDYDEETGFYYLRSRCYDPTIGRFINADEPVFATFAINGVGSNLFAYCSNSPISFNDPSGFAVETALDVASVLWSLIDLIGKPSWANLGFLLWDIASALVPFLPGSYVAKGGKLVVSVASKVDDFSKGSKFLTGTYKKLRKVFKGIGNIEIHHLIEKRFAKLFKGCNVDDFLSIPLTKDLHKVITKRWRDLYKKGGIFKYFKYGSDYTKITYSMMEKAVKEVYKDMPELLDEVLVWLRRNWRK